MDLGLGGRGFLLTGASRGLGFATARALVDDGARVLLSSRSADAVDAAAASLGGAPAATGIAADLADGSVPRTVKVKAGDVEFDARVRIDTPGEANYYRNGGIMQYVLRSLRGSAA